MDGEAIRQFYRDLKELAATAGGKRFFDWWRARVTSVVDPGNPNVSHFLLARRVDFDHVDRILRTDIETLEGELLARMASEQGRRSVGRDEEFSSQTEDWLFEKGQDDGER